MSKVDEVFNLFSRSRGWHSPKEIADWVSIPKNRARKILDFLAKFELVEYDGEREMARAALLGRKVHRLK